MNHETNTTTPTRMPLVALVGRPNVGKSTLFNRLVRRRTALVHNMAGVTRDRLFGVAHWDQTFIRLVDTGGLDFDAADDLMACVQAQTQQAITDADWVLLVTDGAAGLNPREQEIANLLRRHNKPTTVVVNKVDVENHNSRIAEFYRLGMPHVVSVSAEHNRGIDDLQDLLTANLPAIFETPPAEATAVLQREIRSTATFEDRPIRVAVVGRPNVGKSSLVNRLLGENRHLTADFAGTTTDAIDSHVTIDNQDYTLIDTAGIRRHRSMDGRLEHFAVARAFDSMDRADVVVLLLDGSARPSDQDCRIAAMAHDKGKGLMLAVNKWDLIENPEWQQAYEAAVRQALPFADYVPIVKLSAKTGYNMHKLLKPIVQIQQARHRRIGTGELNRFFKEVVEAHPPPLCQGKRPQLYYVSQPLVCPPTFIFSTSRTVDMHFSYVRYLQNSLRKRFDFIGTPLWIKFRMRQKNAKVS